jgi:PhnB protein
MSDTKLEMMPYLFFSGNCEEALNFYREILDGRIEIISRYDNPAMKMPEDFKDKILHASFHFGNYTLFASDVMPKNRDEQMTSNIAISLSLNDEIIAKSTFDKLSANGEVHIPFKKQFWGDWHGNFKDRFGIRWMVNCSSK